jgi:hypothetical protein
MHPYRVGEAFLGNADAFAKPAHGLPEPDIEGHHAPKRIGSHLIEPQLAQCQPIPVKTTGPPAP